MSEKSQEITDEVQEEEVLDLGKCVAFVTKEGGVKLKCEQNTEKIEIDEQGLDMIKGISEIAIEAKAEKRLS